MKKNKYTFSSLSFPHSKLGLLLDGGRSLPLLGAPRYSRRANAAGRARDCARAGQTVARASGRASHDLARFARRDAPAGAD